MLVRVVAVVGVVEMADEAVAGMGMGSEAIDDDDERY